MSSSRALPLDNEHLPRILCLHGGGVTADIFEKQMRNILAHPSISSRFRLVFADGPFLCDAGPGIIPVYADYGPFRRWLRWLPTHPEVDAEGAIHEIWWQIKDAMDTDDREGGRGEWVGLLGFSQGAKLSGSILLEQQTRKRLGVQLQGKDGEPPKNVDWRFAVMMAGRAPLASLRRETDDVKELVTAADISEGFNFAPKKEKLEGIERYVLTTPTVHIHGLADEGLHLHRRLYEDYCTADTRLLVEWDGNHRVVFKKSDVEKVVEGILAVARKSGVIA